MFCQKCGTQNSDAAAFCGKCGTQVSATMPPPPPTMTTAQPANAGNGFSIAGIVCGAIAFLFFPIILGPVGLILGAVGKSKGEEKAVIALVVSALGLVIGMILGAMIGASTY